MQSPASDGFFFPPDWLPLQKDSPDVTPLGIVGENGDTRIFGLLPEDRRKHAWIVGMTGTGKTTALLLPMIRHDMARGKRVIVFDPHGSLAQDIVDGASADQLRDIVRFDPDDSKHPWHFNPFSGIPENRRDRFARGMAEVFQKLLWESWESPWETVLHDAVRALLEYPDATILSLPRMLADEAYGNAVFRHAEGKGFAKAHGPSGLSPTLPKAVGRLFSDTVWAKLSNAEHRRFELGEALREGKTAIFDLSKGKIGAETSELLNGMLLLQLENLMLENGDMPEAESYDVSVHIDEFQNSTFSPVGIFLSEGERCRFDFTFSHQYLAQIPKAMQILFFENIGTIVAFRLGMLDAEAFEKAFGGTVPAEDFSRLDRYRFLVRMPIYGYA
jgi:hypothetical protein